ncbi:MAG TPA: hypothetical protein VGH38_29770, partial [Bryobacteraceae bacterium]
MQQIVAVAKTMALMAVASFFAVLSYTVRQVPDIVNSQLSGLRADANQQADRTRQEVLASLEPAMQQVPELVRQATLLRTDAAKLGDRVVDVADKHLSRISDTV